MYIIYCYGLEHSCEYIKFVLTSYYLPTVLNQNIKLIYGGIEMLSYNKLSDYGIKPYTKINMVLSMNTQYIKN
jgi:hypothetical protein